MESDPEIEGKNLYTGVDQGVLLTEGSRCLSQDLCGRRGIGSSRRA